MVLFNLAPRECEHLELKTFAKFSHNSIIPYSQAESMSLDKKQLLWAFFVLRAIVTRENLKTFC